MLAAVFDWLDHARPELQVQLVVDLLDFLVLVETVLNCGRLRSHVVTRRFAT